ncbi:MAG TPA: twin-arginine translocase TatA/TatE family subunit [Bryobacteraceae bacterium]
MGTLGVQEMVVIFLVALVLFGPKKLPELGRTLGKALTEFRRASSDLKATFEREMQTLDRENESIKQVTHQVANEIYDRVENYTIYDEHGNSANQHLLPEPNNTSTVSASEVSSAESHGTTQTAVIEPPAARPAVEGTVARSEAQEASQHS